MRAETLRIVSGVGVGVYPEAAPRQPCVSLNPAVLQRAVLSAPCLVFPLSASILPYLVLKLWMGIYLQGHSEPEGQSGPAFATPVLSEAESFPYLIGKSVRSWKRQGLEQLGSERQCTLTSMPYVASAGETPRLISWRALC